MASEQVTMQAAPARRPRDRKSQIARSAGDLFARSGFHAVRMEDIAAENGITPRALYRHFASKEELLWAVVTQGQTSLLAALNSLGDGPTTIDELVQAFQRTAMVGFQLGPLWQREARHLSIEHFQEVRDRLRRIATIVTRVVAQQSVEFGRLFGGISRMGDREHPY
jgi:AcrR family transcriptional regulator